MNIPITRYKMTIQINYLVKRKYYIYIMYTCQNNFCYFAKIKRIKRAKIINLHKNNNERETNSFLLSLTFLSTN